jgi:hypothetical protein
MHHCSNEKMDYFTMPSFLCYWYSSSVNNCSYVTQQYDTPINNPDAKILQILSQIQFIVTILPWKWNWLPYCRLLFIAQHQTTTKSIWLAKLALRKTDILHLGPYCAYCPLPEDITYTVLHFGPYCAYCPVPEDITYSFAFGPLLCILSCSWRYYLYSFVKVSINYCNVMKIIKVIYEEITILCLMATIFYTM